MPTKQDRTRIALLIAIAVLAIAFAVLEALAGPPRTNLSGTAAEVSRPSPY